MHIGSLGEVSFEVSSFRIRTFDDFKMTGNARFASHEVINKKQVLEFLGPSTQALSFTMLLSASLGVSPLKELEQLRQMRDSGKDYPLIISDNVIGENTWVIKSLEESVNKFDGFGNIFSVSVSINLEEYIKSGETR